MPKIVIISEEAILPPITIVSDQIDTTILIVEFTQDEFCREADVNYDPSHVTKTFDIHNKNQTASQVQAIDDEIDELERKKAKLLGLPQTIDPDNQPD